MRAACDETISTHAKRLEADLQEAIARHPPLEPVTAESLALYTQTVLQGAFVLSKAKGNREPLLDAITHLKRYFTLLFRTAAHG